MLSDPNNYATIQDELDGLDAWGYLPSAVAAVANDPDSLLLLTVPKSGTTWLRYLLVNYAVQQRRPDADRIGYTGLKRFSTEREYLRSGRNPVRSEMRSFLPKYGMRRLLYQHPRRHEMFTDVEEHGGKKLLGYRNPLDYLVSNYFYFHEYRDGRRDQADGPSDLIDGYVRYWALCWRLFTEKIMPAGNAALISYDRLQDDTAKEFTRALSELGVDVNAEALGRAIPMASAREAADDETRRGRTLVASLDHGSFVRDGSVGQWREHFTADDLARIAAVLDQCGVNPSDALPADVIT